MAHITVLRQLPTNDNSPPDKNKAHPLPNKTVNLRTIPHQDNSPLGPLPRNKTTHQTKRELLHRRQTVSWMVIWYKNLSAHARPSASFCFCQITNTFLPIYHPCRIKNKIVKQPISALVGDIICSVHRTSALPLTLQFAKLQMRRTADEWRGRSQLIALRPRIRRCSIYKARLYLYSGELSWWEVVRIRQITSRVWLLKGILALFIKRMLPL